MAGRKWQPSVQSCLNNITDTFKYHVYRAWFDCWVKDPTQMYHTRVSFSHGKLYIITKDGTVISLDRQRKKHGNK